MISLLLSFDLVSVYPDYGRLVAGFVIPEGWLSICSSIMISSTLRVSWSRSKASEWYFEASFPKFSYDGALVLECLVLFYTATPPNREVSAGLVSVNCIGAMGDTGTFCPGRAARAPLLKVLSKTGISYLDACDRFFASLGWLFSSFFISFMKCV